MTSGWISALASLLLLMLLLSVNVAGNESNSLQCPAKIQTSSTAVLLGSQVTATCIISDSCPLVSRQAVRIGWRLNQHHLPSRNDNVIVIPSFNETRAHLTCCVQQASGCPIVYGVEIRAGRPPPVPQNVTCIIDIYNIKNTSMSCTWYPGDQETHLPTNYTLHTYVPSISGPWKNYTYKTTGVPHFTIPRSDFNYLYSIEMYVKAVNDLGEASSEKLIFEPVSKAKFKSPTIMKAEPKPGKYGCLWLEWKWNGSSWLESMTTVNVEVRNAESNQRSEPVTCNNKPIYTECEVCRLRHGTEYQVKIRMRYQSEISQSPWTEWSSSFTGVTLEKVPIGQIDTWIKLSGKTMPTYPKAHLFWKPSKQFCANGKNVSYSVFLQSPPDQKNILVCTTSGYHCNFPRPRPGQKIFLGARNAAGTSNLTKVPQLRQKVPARAPLLNVTVRPHDDRSLLVQWETRNSSGITDFLVEWSRVLETDPIFFDPSLTFFDLADRHQKSLLISGSLEPYKPYKISVYPRYKDEIGLSLTVNAYSRQKAPSLVPVPDITTKEWSSSVELTWKEIDLDDRNGIISGYRVFFWDDEEHKKVVETGPENRKVVLKELNTGSLYTAFIMASTGGGSLNGSMITFKAPHMDAATLWIIVSVCLLGSVLLITIFIMICYFNNKRLKVHIWPLIPDPANSSIKPWAPESITFQDARLQEKEDDPVYLSHLSLLEMPKQLDKKGDVCWVDSGAEDTSDLGESICCSPTSPGYSRSNSDSVPYATVIVSAPSQPGNHPHAYLRSESTQPLLESDEPLSPMSYQNMTTDEKPTEQHFFGECHDANQTNGKSAAVWDDFPLLRALVMTDAQSEL